MTMEKRLAAFRGIYDRGAFLRLAKPDKSLMGVFAGFEYETDEDGNIRFEEDENGAMRAVGESKTHARSWWGEIEAHVKSGGHVLVYGPARWGAAIADFDPMLSERLDAIEALVGSPAHRSFESSGNVKEATATRPAGKGGHACWRVDPKAAEGARSVRYFGAEEGGESFGELFTTHPGFGVIVWDPVALLEVMELDEAEAVDITAIPKSRYSLGRKDADGNWTGAEGSRHCSAVSAVSKAAMVCHTPEDFDEEVGRIEEEFKAAFTDEERKGRNIDKEWKGILADGRKKRSKDEKKAEADAIRTAAIGKRKAPPDEGLGGGILFEERKASFLEMEELFRSFLRVEIRFNVRAFEYEYRPIGTEDWIEVTERVMAYWVQMVGRACQRVIGYDKNDNPIVKPDIRSLDAFGKDFGVWFSNPALEVDPFLDWIESETGEWDATPRLDTWMRDAGLEIVNGVEDYVRWVCRYLFLGPVQRAYEPGCELQQMPVLWGPRGTGKSSAVEYTMPVIGKKRRWWSDDFRLAKDSKIMIEMTEGYAIIEWPEMRGIVQAEPEEVKAYASGKVDRTRKAYAKKAEVVPRRFVLVATTNDATLKADPALMRRLVVLHIEGGDVGRIRAYLDANRTQLFAEAVHRYRAGERAHLDYHLEDGLDLNNAGAVWRNWSIIETIVEVVAERGTTFSKEEFCDSLGEIPPGIDRKERSRIRDRWWRDNGPRYNKALRDLGFEERRVENKRCFVLEDRKVYDSVVDGVSRTPLPPSNHPQNPSMPAFHPNQGVSIKENLGNEGNGVTLNKEGDGGKGGGSGIEAFEGGLRVVEGGRSGGFVPPDDLDDEFGV